MGRKSLYEIIVLAVFYLIADSLKYFMEIELVLIKMVTSFIWYLQGDNIVKLNQEDHYAWNENHVFLIVFNEMYLHNLLARSMGSTEKQLLVSILWPTYNFQFQCNHCTIRRVKSLICLSEKAHPYCMP